MMVNLVITIEASDRSADLEGLRAVLARHTPALVMTDGDAIRIVCDYPALKDAIVRFAGMFGFRLVPNTSVETSDEWRKQVERETAELLWRPG